MLAIFDFDGVIFEAKWLNLLRAYEAIIKAAGKNPKDFFKNMEEFKTWWNADWKKNNQKIGLGLNKTAESHKIFYETYDFGLGLFPWVYAVIKSLHKNHQLTILTNRHKAEVEKHLGSIKKYFSLIIGCEDIRELKPDPEGINFILWKAAMPAMCTLMIGDMADDIKAAKAARIRSGIVKWGLDGKKSLGSWKELLSLNPDYTFEKHTDLLWI